MHYSSEAIGKTIREEREKRKWTQDHLGKKLGCVGKQISNYEKGKLVPPIDSLLKLCEIFDCELGFLLGEPDYTERTKFNTFFSDISGLSSEILPVLSNLTQNGIRKYNKEEYSTAIVSFISSSQFYDFSEQLVSYQKEYDMYRCMDKDESIVTKYGQAAIDNAIDYRKEYGDPIIEMDMPDPPSHYHEIIYAIDELSLEREAHLRKMKYLRYELQESLIYILDSLFQL